jgi:tRNA-2-methylthio-N6-dimethylallyladenosine synthase
VVEIVLLGQNVNAYHGGTGGGLGELIAAVADIDGIERIRYMTSHPRDMDDDLIAAHGSIRQLMPFLHLPVQSGSDEILKTMNRKHTADHYRDIIARVRKARPDIALSSDFIVGFPGETEAHFEDTMQLIRDIGFTASYSFKYSARPGTPAANMQGLIPEKLKDDRVQRIQALLFEQHTAFNKASIGKTMAVLMDGYGRQHSQLHGRTPYNQAIHITTDRANFGQIMNVRVTNATATSLTGEICK